MNIREARPDDGSTIRSIARRSMTASYGHELTERTIDEAIETWYRQGDLERTLDRREYLLLLASTDGTPIGFLEAELVSDGRAVGQVLWIHVDPDHRGHGYGARLFAHARQALLERGAREIRGSVLSINEEGVAFYRENDFERAGTRAVEVGDRVLEEVVFVEGAETGQGEWRGIGESTVDGSTVYVGFGVPERGAQAPFFPAFADPDGSDPLGWYCGGCDGLDTAMDPMGRIECGNCGNRRKPTRWDAAYL